MYVNICKIDFSNICPQALLEDLASSDKYELIGLVREYYLDYCALNSFLYSLESPLSYKYIRRIE